MSKKKTYAEKLLDPRWQRRRLEMFNSSDWTCSHCGEHENTLHLHHKAYIRGRDPWDYDDDQLTVLCDGCHKKHHVQKDRLDELLSRVPESQMGFVVGVLIAIISQDTCESKIGDLNGIEEIDGYIAGMLQYSADAENIVISWRSGKANHPTPECEADLIQESYLQTFRNYQGPTLGKIFANTPEET